MTEKCKCLSTSHGHAPGKCENPSMEGSTCCEGCEDQKAEDTVGETSALD
jgi:hypothetical protein